MKSYQGGLRFFRKLGRDYAAHLTEEEAVDEERDSGLSGVESGQLTQPEWHWPQSATRSK